MGRLVYEMGVSLDGFVEDAGGGFQWSAPNEDVHRLVNEKARGASAYLFGRRMYEELEEFWTSAAAGNEDVSEVEAEFAQIYVATPRIVFSDSLEGVHDGVRLVRSAAARAEVERLKRESDGHLSLGGPALAASLADLIDDFGMWVAPVVVGDGKPYWPAPVEKLTLTENHTCDGGFLYLRYERAG